MLIKKIYQIRKDETNYVSGTVKPISDQSTFIEYIL